MSSWVLSMKALLISAGIASLAVGLNFSGPISVSGIPAMWSHILPWLQPPYVYFIINAIIITVAASSRFHRSQSEPPPPAVRFEDLISVEIEIHQQSTSFDPFSARPDVWPVEAEPSAAAEVVSEVGDTVVVTAVSASISKVDNETKEKIAVEDGELPPEIISEEVRLESQLPTAREKPLVCSSIGQQSRNRTYPQGELHIF